MALKSISPLNLQWMVMHGASHPHSSTSMFKVNQKPIRVGIAGVMLCFTLVPHSRPFANRTIS